MSTKRFDHVGSFLNLRYHAVGAAEYAGATLKAAFQCATAPADDPVKQVYGVFHDFRAVTQALHAKYREQFADWRHEGKDRNGDTGLWRAHVDCRDIVQEKLIAAGVIKPMREIGRGLMQDGGGIDSYLGMLTTLWLFADASSSEFRFRQQLDYFADQDDMPMAGLLKMAPVIRDALADMKSIDVETLRASKEKHAAKRAGTAPKFNAPQP